MQELKFTFIVTQLQQNKQEEDIAKFDTLDEAESFLNNIDSYLIKRNNSQWKNVWVYESQTTTYYIERITN